MNNYSIPNLVKACAVLKLLADCPQGVSTVEVEMRVQVPRTTAFRILKTLCAEAMAAKRGSLFYAGPALFQIGVHSLQSLEIRSLSIPILRELAGKTGLTAHLAIPSGRRSLILEVQDSPHPVRVASRSGTAVPLHCSSTGKIFLAYREPSPETYFAGEPVEAFTENTITTPAAMRQEMERIKHDGYAIDNHEYHKDVRCLAVPVRDSAGQVVAAIGVTGPAAHLTVLRQAEIGQSVKQAGAELSTVLGFNGEQKFNERVAR